MQNLSITAFTNKLLSISTVSEKYHNAKLSTLIMIILKLNTILKLVIRKRFISIEIILFLLKFLINPRGFYASSFSKKAFPS